MPRDNTAYVAFIGFVGSLTLAEAHLLAATALAVVSVGYVVTKWSVLLGEVWRKRREK